ncbi:MAG: ketoacyl-ACP synthase III [Pseudomonadota bacterium]
MLYLHGAGHFHPDNVIDNAFFESLDINTSDEWIVDRVGIRTRRTVLPLDYIRSTFNADPSAADEAAEYTNAQTGARAAQHALARAGRDPSDVGLVIAGSCTPATTCPAEACTIAGELGIEAAAYDVNSACSSLAAQLHLLMGMADSLPDFVLLVQPDNSTREINYRDRDTCVLWGDGSSAMVLSARHASAVRVATTSFTSSPSGHAKVQFLRHGHFRQEGRTVQTFAIKRTANLVRELSPEGRATHFVGHQANLSMLTSSCRRAGIDQTHHWYNVDRFGNCGAAGAGSVLSEHWDDLTPGLSVVMAVVGSGLSWGGARLEVALA